MRHQPETIWVLRIDLSFGAQRKCYRCLSAFLIRVVPISYKAVVSPFILVDTLNANLPGMHPTEFGTCDFRSSHSFCEINEKECSAVQSLEALHWQGHPLHLLKDKEKSLIWAVGHALSLPSSWCHSQMWALNTCELQAATQNPDPFIFASGLGQIQEEDSSLGT